MNNSDKYDKLEEWVNSLTEEKCRDILLTLCDRMIETEEICFYPEPDKNLAPYWDASGDRLDGIEDEDDDE